MAGLALQGLGVVAEETVARSDLHLFHIRGVNLFALGAASQQASVSHGADQPEYDVRKSHGKSAVVPIWPEYRHGCRIK